MQIKSKENLFRIGAVGLGLGSVFVLELLLRLLGWGIPEPGEDPFVSFAGTRPLFALNENEAVFETATVRTNYFVRDRFSAEKSENTFRAFFLGGSTVQGRPYAIETAFPKWLQLSLEAQVPNRKWEMVNCGGISYASYRLVPILEECLDSYEPDLIVLCTGQNEFLEDRTYGEIRDQATWSLWLRAQFGSSHLLGIMDRVSRRHLRSTERNDGSSTTSVRPVLPEEVDAFLDYENGLEAYHWDPAWRLGVREHFKQNVERMVQLCRQADVPLVILAPPVNLRSNPPFKSEHRSDLSSAELDTWQQLLLEARQLSSISPADAVRVLTQAIELDEQYADTHFALGTLLESIGRPVEARKWFLSANELDVCPLRLLASQRVALAEISKRYGVPYLDLHEFLERRSEYVSLGSEFLVDHVHPSISGHQLIAKELQRFLVAQRYLPGSVSSESADIDRVFRRHFDSLSAVYFVQGGMRLDNLRLWTQGRTGGLPLELKPELEVE